MGGSIKVKYDTKRPGPMKKNNPIVVPRNHKVEEALTEANNGSLEGIDFLNKNLKEKIMIKKILLIINHLQS